MSPEQRIAELEAKLTALQSEDNNGKDPELLAKAKDRARMSWSDIQFALSFFGMDETLGRPDVEALKEALIDRKYDTLVGANKSALGW